MNVSRRCKAKPACKLRTQVTDDVAEEVAGHDDVELARVAHDFHRQRVNVQVVRIDIRILPADLLKNPLPEVMGESHCVGFVAHADPLQAVLARVFKGKADDALHPFAGVHVFLNGNLVRCIFLEKPTNANVKALRVFAEDHHANVFFGAVAQRREPILK